MTSRTRGIAIALLAAAAGLIWWRGRSQRTEGKTPVAQAPSAALFGAPPSAAEGQPVAALPVWATPDGKPFAAAERKLLQRSISNEVDLPGGGRATLRATRPRVTAGVPVVLE